MVQNQEIFGNDESLFEMQTETEDRGQNEHEHEHEHEGEGEEFDPELRVRAIVSSKMVGGIIGKGGEQVRMVREKSGAKVAISPSNVNNSRFRLSNPAPPPQERILTVSGTPAAIAKAFVLITEKLDSDAELVIIFYYYFFHLFIIYLFSLFF